MEERALTAERIAAYGRYLRAEERAPATVEKYLRDVERFAAWLDGEAVTKEAVAGWKEQLSDHHAPSTVNGALAALNGLFRFLGWDVRTKFLKVQRRMFRDSSRELTRGNYDALIATARARGQDRLALVMV